MTDVLLSNITKMPVDFNIADTGIVMYLANNWYSLSCPNGNTLYVGKNFAEARMDSLDDTMLSFIATLQTTDHPNVSAWKANGWYICEYENGFTESVSSALLAELINEDNYIQWPMVGFGS